MLLLPVVNDKLLVAQLDIRTLKNFCFVIPTILTLYSCDVILIILVHPGLTCSPGSEYYCLGKLKSKDGHVYITEMLLI